MGGNVWQWCEDWYDGGQKSRVSRGASWISGGRRDDLLSSVRVSDAPVNRDVNVGFRCVLADSSSR
jgi:serine/threonine-protein kinase